MIEYKTIYKSGESEIVVEKSRFICYCSNAETEEDAHDFISKIKKKNYDATHNVFAYIIGDRMNLQKYSDDKEPSGTAGIPVLEILKKESITNAVVVITRYFGGTKLGAGGLLRAYGRAAKSCLENSTITFKKLYTPLELTVDYSYVKKLQNDFSNRNIINSNPEFMENVKLRIFVPYNQVDESIDYYKNLTSGNIDFKVRNPMLIDFVDNEFIL